MYGQYKVKDASEFMMLGVGQPSPAILDDAKIFINSNINDCNVLQYGVKNGFEKYRYLVQKLLTDLLNTNSDNINFNKDNIYMTNGISQAVFMLASLFKTKGYETVYVEDLTYFIMINIFKDLGFNIKSFKLSELDKLKIELDNNKKSIVYLIPFCNNPTGLTMKKYELDEFLTCFNKDTIILSDETYQFLHYKINKPNQYIIDNRPLALYSDNIISLGTFSKILVPGIRLGWIYSTYKFDDNYSLYNWIDDTGFMDSGGSVNPVIAYIITENLLNKYNEYINFLDFILRDLNLKSQHVLNTLNKYPEHFEVIIPDGGYFIFVKSKTLASKQLLKIASEKCKFNFHEANKFSINKKYNYSFRISVSYYSMIDFYNNFDVRISSFVDNINCFRNDIAIYGNGKLGNLIKEEINTEYSCLTRELNKKDFGKIIIDVTSPQGTINLIKKCYEYYSNDKLPKLIIGTTGHTDEQIHQITKYSEYATVVYCSNFSNGIQNILNIIRNLTFNVNYIEIKDIHHIHKKDSPSGTAKLLKKELEKVYNNIDINIISERTGEIIGIHYIILYGINENITLIHNAENRNIFAKGCIDLINKLKNHYNSGLYEWL